MTLTQTLSAWTPRASRLLLPLLAVAATLATPAAQAKAPEAGQPAPAFRLQDQTGEWRSLADYRGKWVVLYFYPKDGTPGCTTQACEIRDDIFAFRRANAAARQRHVRQRPAGEQRGAAGKQTHN